MSVIDNARRLKPLPRDKKGNLSIKNWLRRIIYERKDIIISKRTFLENEENWCGVTTPYYELRNTLEHEGFNIAEMYTHPIYDTEIDKKTKERVKKKRWGRVILDDARDYIQGQMLRDICKELGMRRDELGIYVQARCTFAFRGKITSIGLDAIDIFKEKGIIIGFVEKSNIARKLSPFLKDYGIALVENGGNFVEYTEILVKRAYNLGCNIAYLTDNDVSGYAMCLPFHFGTRVAIDLADISELAKMKREEDISLGKPVKSEQELLNAVKELYNPSENQLTYVRDKYKCLRAIWMDFDSDENERTRDAIEEYNISTLSKLMQNGGETWNFIQSYRIELDLVVKVFGPRLFAKFIVKRMRESFEVNDYTRAVDLKKGFSYPRPVPEEVTTHILNLLDFFCDAGYEKHNQIHQKLTAVHGILDLPSKEKMIGDKIIQAEKLTPRAQKLLKRVEKFRIPKFKTTKEKQGRA